jgi:hypothetical protein
MFMSKKKQYYSVNIKPHSINERLVETEEKNFLIVCYDQEFAEHVARGMADRRWPANVFTIKRILVDKIIDYTKR